MAHGSAGKGRQVRPGKSVGDRDLPGNGPCARFVTVSEELIMVIIARLVFGSVQP